MNKFVIAVGCLLLLAAQGHSQNIQLFFEGFDLPGSTFTLNTGLSGAPFGPNGWIINNQYNGSPLYANTISQDSTVSGTIGGAPFSNYLHIHDDGAISQGISNANWNPLIASDNFVEMTDGICTKAMEDIKLSYFWLGEGSSTAYGEVYYSINGGAWTKTGNNKYNNQPRWKYELITDPAFADVEDLRFGFHWINPGGGGTPNASFAIDDIIVVGTYDPINNPIDITITSVTPDPVCRGNNLIVFFQLSDTMCFGTYSYELSNGSGSFANPINLGVITFNNYFSTGAVAVGIPQTVTADTCYRIRMNRLSPLPTITGVGSICFEVIDCPNIITTHQPVVTMIPPSDSVCVGSVIDVPFNSTGVYNADNIYTAQLSDSTGSFANPLVIGSSPDPNNYPVLPGSVGGLIPPVPPGCNYFIRVISSSPVAIGSVWGPFCIKECDITTNEMKDIQLCISESFGDSATIVVDIHTYNTNSQYYQGNEFTVEVRNSMNFGLVNIGGLGAKFDTASTSFTIYAPPLPQLLAMGITPGMYYIRIMADSGSAQHDLLGSLVRLTIGAPSEIPAILTAQDTLLCIGDVGRITFFPWNPNSSYEWQSPQLNSGQPFTWSTDPFILINFTGFAGEFRIRVREINFGCTGPFSAYETIDVLTTPNVNISGPSKICIGDTAHFSVPFQNATFYQWNASDGILIDTSNNVSQFVWDSIGTFTVDILALNKCGLDLGFVSIEVIPYPELALQTDDTLICAGEDLMLTGGSGKYVHEWSDGSNIISTDTVLIVTPDEDITYYLTVTNDGGCSVEDSISVSVEHRITEDVTANGCEGRSVMLDAEIPGKTYDWSTGDNTQTIEVTEPGIYIVDIIDPSEVCPITKTFDVTIEDCGNYLFVPNAFSPNGDGLNDRLKIFGSDNIVSFELFVYNRWGELVFYTNDLSALNNPNKGWDGYFKNELQEMGVYGYFLRGIAVNSETTETKGNITLVH